MIGSTSRNALFRRGARYLFFELRIRSRELQRVQLYEFRDNTNGGLRPQQCLNPVLTYCRSFIFLHIIPEPGVYISLSMMLLVRT